MMKLVLTLVSVLFSLPALASGYTFFSNITHVLHVEEHVITFTVIASLIVITGLI